MALSARWSAGDSFVLVEHDVVPTEAQIAEIESCAEPWCLYGYAPGFWLPVFGCVKFSAELIAGTAGVWENEWNWDVLDQNFARFAVSQGFQPHWHYPHVHHDGTRGRRAASVEQKLLAAEAELALLSEEISGDPVHRLKYERTLIKLTEVMTA
jgi:hypothetical protein